MDGSLYLSLVQTYIFQNHCLCLLTCRQDRVKIRIIPFRSLYPFHKVCLVSHVLWPTRVHVLNTMVNFLGFGHGGSSITQECLLLNGNVKVGRLCFHGSIFNVYTIIHYTIEILSIEEKRCRVILVNQRLGDPW